MSSKTKTTATKGEATAALVPKLRFPEFSKPWAYDPLSEFIQSLDAGVSVNSGDRPANKTEYGVLKTSAVTNGIFEPEENKVVFEKVEQSRLKESVCGGTIIISRMNTPALVGANAYVESSHENLFLPDRLWAAKPKEGVSMRFLSFILGSDKGRAALSKLAKGSSGSMKNITKPEVLALSVVAPSPAEQQKIAECLSSVDELMAAQARKVDALKTHKKGLVQQLFPREGETQPRRRFPEFRDAGEWEAQSLEELSKSISSGKDKAATDGVFDLYGSTGIIGKTHNRSYSGNYLLVARVGANAGFLTKATGEFGVTDNTLVIILKAQQSIDFILYYLDQVGLNKMIFGSGQPLITGGQLKALSLQLPKPAEQQRIATCLSSLDVLITAENRKLEALKTHKKGLMQQLFPSSENQL